MRAHSSVVDADAFDLNRIAGADGMLFVRDGVGVAGRGVVATATGRGIERVLASIDHDDRSGGVAPGPTAFGIKPFAPEAPAEFFVPVVAVGRDRDGRGWMTVVGPDGAASEPSLADLTAAPPRVAAGSYRIEAVSDVAAYLRAVGRAAAAAQRGELTKTVIARAIEVIADEPIDVGGVLARLRATFGSSYRFSIDGFIGASPELLVEVDGREVRSYPLAGTAPRTGDAETDRRLADELAASTKNQLEHRVVIDVVHDTLLPWCSYLDWEPEPGIVTVANVQHLGTAIEGVLRTPRPHVVELVDALSPTPALGGHPRGAALDLIAATEHPRRGRYGGAVGYVDAAGNGTWAVAIRCAELSSDRRTARLWAGGGIVAESEPEAELAETQAKFQAMLSAIVRP